MVAYLLIAALALGANSNDRSRPIRVVFQDTSMQIGGVSFSTPAAATRDHNGVPIIVLSPEFVRKEDDGVVEFAIQHEIAHHLLGHLDLRGITFNHKARRDLEFACDQYATRALVAMGWEDKLPLVARWFLAIDDRWKPAGDYDHPTMQERVDAIFKEAELLNARISEQDDPQASQHVKVEEERVTWSSTNRPPIVTVRYRIRNESKRPIQVDILFNSGHIKHHTDPDDHTKWKPFHIVPQRIVLRAGEDRAVQQTLNWFHLPSTQAHILQPKPENGLLAARFSR
jgi:hypothetical protein